MLSLIAGSTGISPPLVIALHLSRVRMRGASLDDGHLTERRTSRREQDSADLSAGPARHMGKRPDDLPAIPVYLLKSSLRKDLMTAIRAAHAGKRYIPAEIALDIAEHVGDEELSAREVEILRKVAQGFSNKQIGAQIGISDETVKTHLKNAFAN
jgi:ATP/maltotriose-dependent transcriptional regulator MalT